MAKDKKILIKATFPEKLVQKPVTYTMAKKFNVMPNVRRSKVTKELGEVIMELSGTEENLEKGLKYFKKLGVIVDPVAGDFIE
ncbi:MAG: NIL domain-containing protein [Candidatus Margulisiibacteriota bacterium]